jgi:FAD/FMN-containing dehydrogenase
MQAAAAIESLRSAFSGRLYTTKEEKAPFLTDWRRKWLGQAIAVAQPDSARDVAHIVRWCFEHRVPMVPQGGNTGLSGGSIPDAGGDALVISLARLSKVRGIDLLNNTMTVEAGVLLQRAQEAAENAGRLFPLSLAAEGSCTIGGNLATNAGGVQVLRYGNARDLCLGLEVVTPTGDVWDGLRGLRKDNSRYALKDLYIGSEGTLGLITAAVLKLFPRPVNETAVLAAVPSPAAAVDFLRVVDSNFCSSLTAFELMSERCIALVEKHIYGSRRPLGDSSPWYVLFEISASRQSDHGREALESLLEAALGEGLITDATLSASVAQFNELWALREHVSQAQGAEGPCVKHDISLPISRIPGFLEVAAKAIQKQFPQIEMVTFGHLGDGNLHYNASLVTTGTRRPASEPADPLAALEEPLNRLVHDLVVEHEGSISAEHGLGVLRRDEAARYRSATELRLLKSIKRALDPHHLMNPGKVLP